MASPLDAFATTTAGSNDLKLPPFPKLEELVKEFGLMAGLKTFDDKLEETRQTIERNINIRLAAQPPATDLSQSNAG